MIRLRRHIPLMLVALTVLLSACSAKKNTAGSRFWQAFNTRYNVYYNGITHYNEQIKVLQDQYEDDYSQQLYIHPAEAYTNPKAPQPSSSFDRTIEKMQKAIALHSIKKKPRRKSGKKSDKEKEWLKRDEYNPFIHNAWYLMGKAQYMKGDFLGASATFHYIARHFTWKPDLVTESQVWEALSYCAMGWTTEADNILAHIHLDKITDKRILQLANLAMADYYIKSKKNSEAIPYLAYAASKAGGSQKVRLNFLLGQLYEANGDRQLAYDAFKKAGSSGGSSYRTKFNARIKQSAVYAGGDIKSEVRSLRSMARYDRNKQYLDQIYYAIGNLYLSRQDTVQAIDNYIMAAKKSTRNGIDKAISQLTLGEIYFTQHKYDLAQPCYAEAISQINEDYPNYKTLKQRSDVLDELAVYSGNVTLQDSLLRLAKMSPEEQQKVIDKIIAELKKKEKEEKEEADREAYMAQQQSGQVQSARARRNAANSPQNYQLNNDNSWYFYNTATKNAGITQFQKLWGTRKLEDDWRRRNKTVAAVASDDNDNGDMAQAEQPGGEGNDSTQTDGKATKRSEDPHFAEYYLKQIPKTEQEIQNSNDIIQEGLYNMGLILKDKLEDYDAADVEFKELLRRYPDNIYRLDTYYNQYLMYMRTNRFSEAESARNQILTNFADSKYGKAMQDPNYLENLKNMDQAQEELYAEAYGNYLANNNEAVHQAYQQMQTQYPLSKIMPKFMFIDALSYVTQKRYDKFQEVLKEMLERYPQTDITPTATAIVKQLNSGRKIQGGGSNMRGMYWSTRLTNDTLPEDIERKLTPFSQALDKPQLYIFVYPTDSVQPNQLLFEVAKHNFTAFVVKNYDMEQLSFGKMGLLVVKGFANYDELVHYRTVLEADKSLVLAPQVRQVLISEANFNLLINEGRSFQEYFQYLEEQNATNVESQIPDNATDDADRTATGKQRRSVKGTPAKTTQKPAAKAEQKNQAAATIVPAKNEQKPADTKQATQEPAKTEQKPATENSKQSTKPAENAKQQANIQQSVDTSKAQDTNKAEQPATKPAETSKEQGKAQTTKPAAKTETKSTQGKKAEPKKEEPKKPVLQDEPFQQAPDPDDDL